MGIVIMAALAWVLFLVVVSSCIALLLPIFRRSLRRVHPSERAHVLRAVASAPAALAIVGVSLCFAPKVLDQLLSQVDHCVEHGGHHPHFCLAHLPEIRTGAESSLLLAAFASVGIALAIRQTREIRRSVQRLETLQRTATYDPVRQAWVIESELPVALSAGFLRPRIVLSTGLLGGVAPEFLRAILAHERAHVRRRDGLWRLLTDFISIAHFPGTRRTLAAELSLACEQACDEEAALEVGSRALVARALLAVERRRSEPPALSAVAPAFAEGAFVRRVHSLVEAPLVPRWDRRAAFVLGVAACAAAALAADPFHHFTETLLHRLLG